MTYVGDVANDQDDVEDDDDLESKMSIREYATR